MSTPDSEEPLTSSDKFDQLINDFAALMDNAKHINARLKVLQKEVNKAMKSNKRPRRVVEVDPNAPKKVSALQRPVKISNELCKFLGFEENTEHSRQEVTTSINNFIKVNDLQDPTNRRFIKLDGNPAAQNLKKLLRDPDQPVTFFNIQRYLKPHYPPSERDKKVSANAPDIVLDAAVVEDTPKVPPPPTSKPPVKKRVVRKSS